MTQGEIAEAELVQDVEPAGDRRLVLEETDAFLDRHVQDLGDRFAAVHDLQCLRVVARAFAALAG